jgi:hypothetical protein
MPTEIECYNCPLYLDFNTEGGDTIRYYYSELWSRATKGGWRWFHQYKQENLRTGEIIERDYEVDIITGDHIDRARDIRGKTYLLRAFGSRNMLELTPLR